MIGVTVGTGSALIDTGAQKAFKAVIGQQKFNALTMVMKKYGVHATTEVGLQAGSSSSSTGVASALTTRECLACPWNGAQLGEDDLQLVQAAQLLSCVKKHLDILASQCWSIPERVGIHLQ
eukprot:1790195-Amphidinium_carterae.6